mmetsp:Transcript_3411/g.5093  ORF Transcript_3411/g.5093 Transcript_3411/m.5093 type:complete len:236 (-) Transcript_3411:371-1078(-)|eukprot:CAMPEP_0194199552 /NCGR_PEP_ID=MMETSP0156-20130528/532_1 /TAXON_ID=33649 /ORGANISM="Thalassionema nitzschioides, Strain L26-B" /LENGTH=235 /DNA_ID=CAMNT_0038924469 /DNA_START=59 /DNA_END=766 /DNA_ORIENTATION=+
MKFQEEKKEQFDDGEMIVVTGYKRSGTSLMMSLLKNLGVELNYCHKFEKVLQDYTAKSKFGGKNNFYFEDPEICNFKAKEGKEIWYKGGVKMFAHVATDNISHVPDDLQQNVKIIWMHREAAKIETSIRRYKKPGVEYLVPGAPYSTYLEDDLEVISVLDELHLEAIRKHPNVLTIEFDDLFKDPAGVVKDVAKFLDKSCDNHMVDKFVNLLDLSDKVPSSTPIGSSSEASQEKA